MACLCLGDTSRNHTCIQNKNRITNQNCPANAMVWHAETFLPQDWGSEYLLVRLVPHCNQNIMPPIVPVAAVEKLPSPPSKRSSPRSSLPSTSRGGGASRWQFRNLCAGQGCVKVPTRCWSIQSRASGRGVRLDLVRLGQYPTWTKTSVRRVQNQSQNSQLASGG